MGAHGVFGRRPQVITRVKQTNTSVARVLSRVDSDGSGDLDILELQEAMIKLGCEHLNELEIEEMLMVGP